MRAENRVCPSIHEVREGPATRVWLPLVSSQKKKENQRAYTVATLLIHSQNRLSMQCTYPKCYNVIHGTRVLQVHPPILPNNRQLFHE